MSQLKIKNGGTWEAIPAGGVGVPSGGTTGQYLKKSSSVDYATEWSNLPSNLTLLWENDSPTSAMANDTQLPIDGSYPLYLVIYKLEASNNQNCGTYFLNGFNVTIFGASGYYNKVYERSLNWNTGYLSAGNAYAGSSSVNNSVCIPLKIYGVKL